MADGAPGVGRSAPMMHRYTLRSLRRVRPLPRLRRRRCPMDHFPTDHGHATSDSEQPRSKASGATSPCPTATAAATTALGRGEPGGGRPVLRPLNLTIEGHWVFAAASAIFLFAPDLPLSLGGGAWHLLGLGEFPALKPSKCSKLKLLRYAGVGDISGCVSFPRRIYAKSDGTIAG